MRFDYSTGYAVEFLAWLVAIFVAFFVYSLLKSGRSKQSAISNSENRVVVVGGYPYLSKILGWLLLAAMCIAAIVAILESRKQAGKSAAASEVQAAVAPIARKVVAIPKAAEPFIYAIKTAKGDIDACTNLGLLIRQQGHESAADILFTSGMLPFGPNRNLVSYAREENFENIWFGWARPSMTTCEVLAALGFPDDINTTRTVNGDRSQWVYRDKGVYVYMVEGIAITVQD